MEASRREAAQKDAQLVDAALGSDRVVFSLDDRARGHYSSLAHHVPQLRNVHRVNPDSDHEECAQWLKEGLPVRRDWQLGSPIPDTDHSI